MRRAIVLAVIGTACTPRLEVRFSDPGSLPVESAADRESAPAVMLLDHQELIFDPAETGSLHKHLYHGIVKVLTERGRDQYQRARMQIIATAEGVDLHGGATDVSSKMGEFKARTIAADGTIYPVDPTSIVEDTASYAEEGGSVWQVALFQFPHVEVGSVLEYSFVVVSAKSWPDMVQQSCSRPIPVKRCEVEVYYDHHAHAALEVHNSSAQPVVERYDTDFMHAKLVVENIPAWPDEPFTRSPLLRDPWWDFRVLYTSDHGGVSPALGAWNEAATGVADRLAIHTDDLVEDFKQKIPTDGCDQACLIERAVNAVREQTETAGWYGAVRPLKALWEGGSADWREKAALMLNLLTTAGVDAKLALIQRADVTRFDASRPTARFDHYLIYVPASKASPAVWIDPACESCKAGELGPWTLGTRALVIEASKSPIDAPVVNTSFLPVTGQLARPSSRMIDYDVQLAATGDATVSLKAVDSGAGAIHERWRIRSHDDKARSEDDASFAATHWPAARLKSTEPIRCDKAAATCERTMKMDMPSLATSSPSSLVVPLSILRSSWDEQLPKLEREDDLEFPENEQFSETAVFTHPSGDACTWQLPTFSGSHSSAIDASVTTQANGGKLTVTRTLRVQAGIFPKSDYPAIRAAVRAFARVRGESLICRRAVAAPPPPVSIVPAPVAPATPGQPPASAPMQMPSSLP